MSSTRLDSPQRHIPALDGLRGLAIIGVLGIHMMYEAPIPPPPPSFLSFIHIFQFGWMGVDLFFVLSGFLITGILLDTCASNNYFRVFYARRVLRIFPLYYGVLFMAMLLAPLVRHTSLAGAVPDHSYWWVYFTYMQSWWLGLHPKLNAGVTADFWSLGVEEQFYLIWPLLVWLLSRKAFTRVCFIICILCPLLRWGILTVTHQSRSIFVFSSTITRMDTLVWGALLAVAVRSPAVLDQMRRLAPVVLAVTGAAILAIDFIAGEFYTRAFWNQTIGYSINAIFFAAVLLMAYISDAERGRFAHWLDLPLLRSFGRYSYAMYVLHGGVILLLQCYVRPLPWYGKSAVTGILLFLAFFVVMWVVGWLSFFLYERHFLHFKKYFKADRRDPRTMPGHLMVSSAGKENLLT